MSDSVPPPSFNVSGSSGAVPPESGTSSASDSFSIQNIDPTGVWTRFLSRLGCPATPKDVQLFIKGVMNTFNTLIQQDAAAAKRAANELKKAIKGQ